METPASIGCPVARSAQIIGNKWTPLIVRDLARGHRRFSELERSLAGISPKTLSERLKRLERERVVRSRRYEARPPRFVYELTADGHELAGALRLLADWGARSSAHAEPLRHSVCGTPVEARWFCPTCARAVGAEENAALRFV